MQSKERIIQLLETLDEHPMARDIFVPVLKKMGLLGVKFVGGSDEQGVDIEYYELTQPENHKSPVAVQFKKGSLHYSALGRKDSVKEVQNQAEEAFDKEIFDVGERSLGYIGRYIVAVTGDINEPAKKMIGRARLKGKDRRIDYWTGDRLAEFIQNHWMAEFEDFFAAQLKAAPELKTEEEPVINADYVAENFADQVKKAKSVRRTVNGTEWDILRAALQVGPLSGGNLTIDFAELLMELGHTEDYYDDELKHLSQLGYIDRDEDGLHLIGQAEHLTSLATTIISELDDAEEDPNRAEEIFDESIG